MARRSRSGPVRTLIWLTVVVAVLFGSVAAGAQWSTASWSPKLALDLAGGTQIVLSPVVAPGEEGRITDETINDAIAIMRQRVDSTGVSEATVSSQGGRNIVIELPGDPEEQRGTAELVRRSAQMMFRPVLAVAGPAPVETEAPAVEGEVPADGTTDEGATDEGAADEGAEGGVDPTTGEPVPAPTATTDGRAVPRLQALTATDAAPTVDPTTEPAAPTVETPAGEQPTTTPQNASDPAWITEAVAAEFYALDCTDPANLAGGIQSDSEVPLVTCAQDGSAKYILGPVEVEGRDLTTASAGMVQNSQGFTTGEWAVNLEFNDEGARKFREVTTRLTGAPSPTDQFGIVLDGLVISAPQSRQPITDGRAQITGNFTQATSAELANQLKFGALPISFEVQTEEQISAVLGTEQLRNGLIAGLIGLGMIVIFALVQYRALGLLVVASLAVAGLITYGLILLMGWYQGYRLSLPGVTGLIISIGVTADSFIVYFERVRDELREGRTLPAAVENGWLRARRTIIVSDCINFLAAAVLYTLAVGGVRGFAFTLGLTTLVDLLLFIMFTHPVMALLARRRFFADGHRWSGMSALKLGRPSVYAGRGKVRTPAERAVPSDDDPATGDRDGDLALVSGGQGAPARSGRMTIAERKAAQAQALSASGDPGAPPENPGPDHEPSDLATKED